MLWLQKNKNARRKIWQTSADRKVTARYENARTDDGKVDYDDKGSPKGKSVFAKTKAECEKKLAKMIAEK